MRDDFNEFFVWLGGLELGLGFISFFLGLLLCHSNGNSLRVVKAFEHGFCCQSSISISNGQPLQLFLLSLNEIINALVRLLRHCEVPIKLFIHLWLDLLILLVVLVTWGPWALAECRTHLLIDTFLELRVKIGNWLKNVPNVWTHFVELAFICQCAIFFDELIAAGCRGHQERPKDHKDNGNDEENGNLKGNADAVLGHAHAARHHDGDHGNGNHYATEDRNWPYLLNLVIGHVGPGHLLALLNCRADEQVERVMVANHARKNAHNDAENSGDHCANQQSISASVDRILLH